MRVRLSVVAILLLAAAIGGPAWSAAGPVTTEWDSISGWDIHHDTSPPLRDIAVRAELVQGFDHEIAIQEPPAREHQDIEGFVDPVLQTRFRPIPDAGPTPPPGLSVEGLDEDDNRAVAGVAVVPPDTNGDVGRTQYVQFINLVWGVFDKTTGALIGGPFKGNSFWQGFGGACQTTNDGDPVVLYDDLAGRWVVSQFAINSGTQCVAVSTTDDALGTYNRYAFVVTPGGLNDYPKLGVWTDGTSNSQGQSAYTFTTRDFGAGFHLGSGVFERDKMLNGQAAQFKKFVHPCTGSDCVEGLLPPHLDGSPPPAGTCPTYFAASDTQFDADGPWTVDGYRNYTICVNWSNINASTWVENPIAPSSAFDRSDGNGFSDCITAPGEVLDCLTIFTMYRAQYRWLGKRASVVLNHSVDIGNNFSSVRWAELQSKSGYTAWTVRQDGTYAPGDGAERWMGSAAQDSAGNIAVGYSVTSAALNPAVRYTSRMEADPLGTMPGGEVTCHAGTGAQTGSANRWGDYSAMSVDPIDPCKFWYTTEYYQTTSSFNFKTRICSFQFPSCPARPAAFVLDDIVPGAANQLNTWQISGANPGAMVTVVCNPQGSPLTVTVGTAMADGSGNASISRNLPPGASGRTIECTATDNVEGEKSPILVKKIT